MSVKERRFPDNLIVILRSIIKYNYHMSAIFFFFVVLVVSYM